MANSDRRYLDHNGNQFMPMNVEGGSWDEEFFSTKKLVVIGIILISLVIVIMNIAESHLPFIKAFMHIAIWAFISSLALRFIVFEERFYYRMYKVMKDYEITTPSIFWDIASLRDTSDGAILTYSDSKVAILVKIERDTITGKHPDFIETHYDAISDFYRELNRMKYGFVQFNVMEKAGKDPRLENLDHLVHKSDNENICKLMEKEIGYIKSITHNTLYESDYILIYTNDMQRSDNLISDAIDCLYKLMDGAYIGYSILSSRDIIELIKEQYGVKYFNYTQATLDMYKRVGASTEKPFTLYGIEYSDGTTQELDFRQINKIYSMTSDILSGAQNIDNISIKKTLAKKERKDIISGVDFDTLGQGFHGMANQASSSLGQRIVRDNKVNSDTKPISELNMEEYSDDDLLDF